MEGNNPAYYHYIPKGQFSIPITTGEVSNFPSSYSPQPPSCLYESKPTIHNEDAAGYGQATGLQVPDGRGDDGLAIQQQYVQLHGATMPMHSPTNPQDLSRPLALAQQACSQSQQCDGLPINSLGSQQPNYPRMHGLSMAAHHPAMNGGQGQCHGQLGHQPLYTMASEYPMSSAKMSKNVNVGQNLQFPWMKTTKSHAHMWKANWPGKILFPFAKLTFIFQKQIRQYNHRNLYFRYHECLKSTNERFYLFRYVFFVPESFKKIFIFIY